MELAPKHLAIILNIMEDKFYLLVEAVRQGHPTAVRAELEELDSLAELGLAIGDTGRAKAAAKAKGKPAVRAKKTKTSAKKKKKKKKAPPVPHYPGSDSYQGPVKKPATV